MRFRRAVRRLLGRERPRPRRGTPRLVADLAAVESMTRSRARLARARLEEAVGPELLRLLDRELGFDGRLAPRRHGRRLRRAA